MNCPDCVRAEADPWSPRFSTRCLGCSARSLANSPAYFDSARDGVMTPTYKAALQYVFGEDWAQGHERVKAQAGRLELRKRASDGAKE